MKLFSKIKALFSLRGEVAEMEVSSAEIKQGKVFLHPADNGNQVVCINTTAVDIVINPHGDIREEDISFINLSAKKADKPDPIKENDNKQERHRVPAQKPAMDQEILPPPLSPEMDQPFPEMSEYSAVRKPISAFMPKMKKISITLYEDEYNMLMDNINTNGYRRTEYFLACINAAKKNSLEATYRKYTTEHKERRAADRQAAQLAQEQDFLLQQSQLAQFEQLIQ